MAPDQSKTLRVATFAMQVIAASAVEIAAVDTRPVTQSLGLAALWVVIAALAAMVIPRARTPEGSPPHIVLLLVILLGASPFLVEPLRRDWTGDGYPLELQMVFALRNAALGLAACCSWKVCLRLAAVASLFLMLFSASMTNHQAVKVLLVIYTVTGSIWLMLANRLELKRHTIAPAKMHSLESRKSRRITWLAAACALILVTTVLGVAFAPTQAAQALGEWLCTSGGTGGYDPYARGGINDGDDETSGNNARSTGMTQTESFLESPLPSLYDVGNEKYGPPHKPKDIQHTISLDARNKFQTSHKRPPDSLRPSRSFAASRKGREKPDLPLSRSARAIFEVEGATPLHISVTAFDKFDGSVWHEAPLNPMGVAIEKEPESDWMRLVERELPIYAEPETHSFKITAPEGSFIPSPPHLMRFRMGRVNRASFFAWAHDRVLTFAGRSTPSGIVVDTESQTVDPELLGRIDFDQSPTGRYDYHVLPSALHPDVGALARSWVKDVPRGWQQIHQIVEHLRTDYVHASAKGTLADCTDPLHQFLLVDRSGPDYQFATAAAILLRINGYQTRLVSGFYAGPEHYDPETRHTPVVKEDIHFWAEVLLPNGDWLVLEPTPGFDVPPPKLTLAERIKGAARAFIAWSERNVVLIIPGLGLFMVAHLRRRELVDAIAVRWWRWFPGSTWRIQVRNAVRLLERRGRWAGSPRTSAMTAATWLSSSLHGLDAIDADVQSLSLMVEWAVYAPELPPPWPERQILPLCRRVIDVWTARRWRRRAIQPTGATA